MTLAGDTPRHGAAAVGRVDVESAARRPDPTLPDAKWGDADWVVAHPSHGHALPLSLKKDDRTSMPSLPATIRPVTDALTLSEFLDFIPPELRDRSGSLLYTGRNAWSGSSDIYLLGYNPGGTANDTPGTVTEQVTDIFSLAPDHSSYRNEGWRGRRGGRVLPDGHHRNQRAMLHLFDRLGLDAGAVPASNLIYARSPRAADIRREAAELAEACWPFHAAMIERLGVKVVVAYKAETAAFVRSKVGAHDVVDSYAETYPARHATSRTYAGPGPTVVHITHPTYADWRSPHADISPLVARALGVSVKPAETARA